MAGIGHLATTFGLAVTHAHDGDLPLAVRQFDGWTSSELTGVVMTLEDLADRLREVATERKAS
jgi:hypothetical protein